MFPFVVPPPSMSVSLTPSGTIYESALLVITCNAALPSVVDTDVSANVTWTGPSGAINGDERILVGQVTSYEENSTFQSELMFSPVDNGDMMDDTNDSGNYTCTMEISSTNTLILNGMNSANKEITVAGMCFECYK